MLFFTVILYDVYVCVCIQGVNWIFVLRGVLVCGFQRITSNIIFFLTWNSDHPVHIPFRARASFYLYIAAIIILYSVYAYLYNVYTRWWKRWIFIPETSLRWRAVPPWARNQNIISEITPGVFALYYIPRPSVRRF